MGGLGVLGPASRGIQGVGRTSIKRGGLGGSVKCPKSNLQPLFQVVYVMEFDEHSTKHPHTKFQTQILMYGKAAAIGSLLHIVIDRKRFRPRIRPKIIGRIFGRNEYLAETNIRQELPKTKKSLFSNFLFRKKKSRENKLLVDIVNVLCVYVSVAHKSCPNNCNMQLPP
jgi:hypothetical protein